MNTENIGSLVFSISVLINLYYYDRILKAEYSSYYEQWLKDGSPIGFFWVPKGSKLISGSFSRGRLSFKWSFKTPDWANNDKTVLQHLYKMRTSGAVGIVAWFVIVICFLSKL